MAFLVPTVVKPPSMSPKAVSSARRPRPRMQLAPESLSPDTLQPLPPDVSIVAGSVALCIPFFVAAVLFGERIYRQRTCEKCRGSGLVKMGSLLKRCPKCGGFLPWQSWRRFFTG
ncbi:hypothetical protein BWQ96_06248 [Gracilariopsis chorda]|uniref:Viral late gene transcription factor 3 zinc ribbon domain-containing protein n=1 Tax=Gracilariopsis chorda TaxID=448386 RepID=A0A2V3IPJ8_9FLOR|nr:hypothetical protein BWQ96_06248 [Gracilariopsis chorda]|eukprot:PXF44015.1 hypothetical protein BWQ96_06248 [Gracilariopsis chorda]